MQELMKEENGLGSKKREGDNRIGRNATDAAICAAFGFYTGCCLLFGCSAPFGAAFLAGLTKRRAQYPAYIGVIAACLAVPDMGAGLRSAAAATVVLLCAEALRKLVKVESRIYAGISAAVSAAIPCIVFLIVGGTALTALIMTAEVLLASCFAVMSATVRSVFRRRNYPKTDTYVYSLCVLLAVIALACPGIGARGFVFFPGRAFASLLVLAAARREGIYGGLICGLMLGLLCDLRTSAEPVFTAAFALAGMAASAGGRHRVVSAAMYSVTCILIDIVIWGTGLGAMAAAAETLCGVVVFCVLPEELLTLFFGSGKVPEHGAKYEEKLRSHMRARLSMMATAYDELSQTVNADACAAEELNPFTAPVKRICSRCEKRQVCWKDSFGEVRTTLELIKPGILAKGFACPEDFGKQFRERCEKLGEFCECATLSIREHRRRMLNKYEENENKLLLRRQYKQASEAFDDSARAICEEISFERTTEEAVQCCFRDRGIKTEVLVYRGKNGKLIIEVTGGELEKVMGELDKITVELSQSLGRRLRKPEQIVGRDICCVCFTEQPDFCCKIGADAEKRCTEDISGDCGTYFTGSDGTTYVILCDGMGSGTLAHEEAARTLKLLESFLQAGLTPSNAADIVLASTRLCSETLGTSTVDICIINPNTSELYVIKYGSAPTYVRRRAPGGDYKVVCAAVPEADSGSRLPCVFTTHMKLQPGDMIIMASDGVGPASEGAPGVKECLARLYCEEPREIACLLLRTCPGDSAGDDRTVIAIEYCKCE